MMNNYEHFQEYSKLLTFSYDLKLSYHSICLLWLLV